MMNLLRNLWNDESGYVLTSEAVLVGTVAVVGGTVGLNAISHSVNEELVDVAKAIRSVDQSYCISGFSGCGSCTSGSSFTQRSVEESLAEIDLIVEDADEKDEKAKHRHKHDGKMDHKKKEARKRHSEEDGHKKSRKRRMRMELNDSETKKGDGVSPLRKNEVDDEIF